MLQQSAVLLKQVLVCTMLFVVYGAMNDSVPHWFLAVFPLGQCVLVWRTLFVGMPYKVKVATVCQDIRDAQSISAYYKALLVAFVNMQLCAAQNQSYSHNGCGGSARHCI